jgi:hypothetical protein
MIVYIMPGFFLREGGFIGSNPNDVAVLAMQFLLVFHQSAANQGEDLGQLGRGPCFRTRKFGKRMEIDVSYCKS